MTFNIKPKHKRDTLESWTNRNPTPLNGEIIIVEDTENNEMKLKIGNGIDDFITLPYIILEEYYSNSIIKNVELTRENNIVEVTLPELTGLTNISVSGTSFSAELNDNIIKITRLTADEENGLIIVNNSEEGDTTYNIATVINVHNDGIEFVTWADGTDEQIAKMIEAAHLGELVLTDYWASGDKRTIVNKDTSTITAETLDLILYRNDSSSGSTGTSTFNFFIVVDLHYKGTSTKSWTYTYAGDGSMYEYTQVLFGSANLVLDCIPESLNNLLLTQRAYVGVNVPYTSAKYDDVKVTYGGNYIDFLYPELESSEYYYGFCTTYGTKWGDFSNYKYYYYMENGEKKTSTSANSNCIISVLKI